MDDATAPAPFDFRRREPGPPLDRHVELLWYARGTVPYARERIAPTGSTVAVVVLGDAIRHTADDGRGEGVLTDRGFLLGPHDGPVVNEPTGETHAVGVVTTPVGCLATLGVAPATLRGRVVLLEEHWPAAAALRDRLLERTDDPEAVLDELLRTLLGELRPPAAQLDRCERAVALLEEDPTMPVADVAGEVGLSQSQLSRDFTHVVGVSPRTLSRLLRVRRLLADVDVHGQVRWGTLAAELGWYDQAHLIRDFKRHTGVTPTEYLAAQRTWAGDADPADAAGFVPEA